ncbi:MAG: dihydroorotate dehydrogenase-like protein [Chloroflexota bacterium]|nr:MAG: dihydroorotate dehydrogenase-like protein [Chloroflexota bacterium]
MVDLSTSYLGLKLKNPLVASASPLSQKVETVQQLERAGIAAVVMYSLFEEQIIYDSLRLDRDLTQGTESYAEALSFFPDLAAHTNLNQYNIGPDVYIENLSKLKESVEIPVIGSLNGVTNGGWIEYAKKIEDAGADALELNIYNLPTDPGISAQEIENEYLSLVRSIRGSIGIPIAIKLSPFFTNLPNFAQNLVEAGVNGLVLFNRFYQPDLDLEELEVVPSLVLSNSQELRLPLRWIAILFGRIAADFALTTGIHTAEDVLKATMAGASVSMAASTFLKYGIDHGTEILEGISSWMEEHEYESITQMKGSMSQQSVAEPAAFERANYIKVLSSFDLRFAP